MSENRYFLLFIDNCTRMAWVYFLINKSNAFECFKKFKAMTELQSGHKVKSLRSDRGGEFMSNEFHEYCSEGGIQRQLTVAYSPQQNGVAERKNRTSLKEVTPFEAYTGRKPGIAHLKAFGALCHVLIPSALRHKLEENSHKCIFVGYGLCEKGYRVYNPRTRKIILSRDVYFDETASWKWENTSNVEVRTPMQMENQDNIEHEQMVANESIQILDTQMQEEEETVPQGYDQKNKETKVYKLNKALYGLKQAPRAWYDEIDAYFNNAGFKKSSSEATLYVKTNDTAGIIIVSLYVDDIIYTSSCPKLL
ncbi:hypothetical protein L3X38_041474 [Prunus dulcis]|uniref:Integrase catalytic domain-containing protein n=1 Tax=Prunus dulcis TaxID=3755 RepID=A0AAD4UUU2_PRUDU|nr:hypothetical protein L3X38_041474 [Prunus dulcis]